MNYLIATIVVATRELSLIVSVLYHVDVAPAVRCSSRGVKEYLGSAVAHVQVAC